MDASPDWAERFYQLYVGPYVPGTNPAKARAEQGMPKLSKYLPKKGSQVLDLCCGGGVYLFALEKAGYHVTGLDIQDRMIALAREHAKKVGSEAKIVKGDATRLKLKRGTFDAVVFMGATTGHSAMKEMRDIVAGAHVVLRPSGRFVAEINDHVALAFSWTYQRVLCEPSGDKDTLSIHTRYGGDSGTFSRLFLDLETESRRFKGSFQIWAPWILDYLMEKAGFERKATEPGAFGIFSGIYVYKKRKI